MIEEPVGDFSRALIDATVTAARPCPAAIASAAA